MWHVACGMWHAASAMCCIHKKGFPGPPATFPFPRTPFCIGSQGLHSPPFKSANHERPREGVVMTMAYFFHPDLCASIDPSTVAPQHSGKHAHAIVLERLRCALQN